MTPKTCKISKGTTLEGLARYFDLSNEQLKRYHNTYCPLEDLIGYEIPEHVRIIYVPPLDKELREKIFNPVSGTSIRYKNKNILDNTKSYQKNYGITQKIFHNDEEKLKIHYKTQVKKIGSKIEILKHPVYINHQRPDVIIEQIAEKIGNIFYPLSLELNENGTVREISNFKQIHDKWLKLKPELKDYYKGNITDEIFDKISKELKHKSGTLNKITNTLFYLFYFFPLYEVFDEKKKYIFQLQLPLTNDEKLLLKLHYLL